ncbi:hypothetical protein A2960_01105 [Candidatus Gottesmanbacteria bacterium RIFCSPLOWO2_01_FULL_39_12b]|uniref:Peptidoglycan glycosyltransferase n=1 Tax=Candidatus Gottesmanbacteria bacterium RIFCSPLOWO2_01_FULL_39_12b TaxID=1798388 RepID=A0A1F6AQJ0_9BACT|nr:MAG: hypothetical protein A2960_01105 [Candidatus Gottesmanbacteria bacterium RIFCSPLOWO2_01_FULL_39_12b]
MEKRLYLVFFLYILLFFLVIIKLYYWQISSFDRLKGLSESQTLTTLSVPAVRGNIYAADGSPLVLNQSAFLVYAEPQKIKKSQEVITALSKELEIPSASLSALISNQGLKWVSIAEKVDEKKIEAIKQYKIEGIGFTPQSKRYYPEASMAAHLLGFLGKNAKSENQGYFGIEGFYDEQLKGRDGIRKQEEDAVGNPILSERLEEIPAENGRDLYLTIDKTAQFITENKLSEAIIKYGAKGGSVIILEPKTGSVIAMASFPAYDPLNFSNFESKYYNNPVVSSAYEPGSTFKVLVMAAALNEGKVKPDTKYDETGPVEIGEYSIKTWNQKYHGEITLAKIMEYSSNVGMVYVENQLGHDLFLKYLDKLGFGVTTDIDLQEESSPVIRQKGKWYPIDYATASFGQGIAVTPLQMVRAVSAIANGGKLVKPYVVKMIKLQNGKIINISPRIIREVFKKETSALITEMMVSAVENGETKNIKPIGYRIAGKTGTAQIPIAGHYDTDKTIASFIGFAPVDNPKFVMLVTINEPTSSPWGSETAAPVFFEIAKELFTYYGISP